MKRYFQCLMLAVIVTVALFGVVQAAPAEDRTVDVTVKTSDGNFFNKYFFYFPGNKIWELDTLESVKVVVKAGINPIGNFELREGVQSGKVSAVTKHRGDITIDLIFKWKANRGPASKSYQYTGPGQTIEIGCADYPNWKNRTLYAPH